MFDIQNMNHPIHKKSLEERRKNQGSLLFEIKKIIKNILKLILRPIKYYSLDRSYKGIIFETPTDPEEINLFSTHETTSMYSAHLFNARLHSAPGPFEVESMEALEEHVKTLVFDFNAARSRTSLFVLNDRFTRMPGEEQQPLSNLGENWGNISDGLKNTHKIYSNGYVKIFLSPNA